MRRGGQAVATVSIGVYRSNPKVGGDFKIGVCKEYQGHGYGRLCILYAFSKLNSMGIKIGESAIRIKRVKSLFLHFELGFRPQYDMRYLACKSPSASLKNMNFLFKLRERKVYNSFLNNQKNKFAQQ